MHVIQGATVEFIAASSATIEDANSFDAQLYDMFIPATADNCPYPSIRNRPDGHITGDVFEKTNVDGADAWIFRTYASSFSFKWDTYQVQVVEATTGSRRGPIKHSAIPSNPFHLPTPYAPD